MTPLFPSFYEEAVFWAFFSVFLVLIAWIGRAQRALRSKESVKKRESDVAQLRFVYPFHNRGNVGAWIRPNRRTP